MAGYPTRSSSTWWAPPTLSPGPNSTEMAIHLGHTRAGFAGLLVAGACFILPATPIVTACAWAYVRFGARPQAEGILYGVKPVIIAIVLQALWVLARTALKTPLLAGVDLAAAVFSFLGVIMRGMDTRGRATALWRSGAAWRKA